MQMAAADAVPRGGGWGARAHAWAEQEEQQAPVYRAALDRVAITPRSAVLDLGCGAGVFLRHAADRGAAVTGLDAAPELLALAAERVPGADLRLGDLGRLPFADATFDVVTAFNSLFFADDMTATLREAGRVAKPGAPILVQVWGQPERSDLAPMLRAVGRLAPGRSGVGAARGPLWEPGVLEGLARDAGLVPGTPSTVTATLEYPDEATLLRRLLAAGGVVEAIRAAGEQAVRGAVLDALAPHRTQNGAYRLENEFVLFLAHAAASNQAPEPVVVVGAGAAGIAAAAALGRAGVPAVVLERGDGIGAAWRGRYDRLRLNTPTWTSRLPGTSYAAAGRFPARDEVVAHLEEHAERHGVDVRLGVAVDRIDRDGDGWVLQTGTGAMRAAQVVVATGFAHTPVIPPWPGRDRFSGTLLHAAAYRDATAFRGADVLVVGPGSSGLEIAYDLVEGGAARVRLAVRTPPNLMLRQSGGLPGDLPAAVLMRLPSRLADAQARLVRRLTVGDLRPYGLTAPAEGIFARHARDDKAPAIVDKEVVAAIRDRRIVVVAAVASLDETGVVLADGARVEPDAVIAATGYGRGLEALAGHLGVLDEDGRPTRHGGPAAAPGLRFVGYTPGPGQLGRMGREGVRAARQIAREVRAAR